MTAHQACHETAAEWANWLPAIGCGLLPPTRLMLTEEQISRARW
ncbi:hypothetical protein [Kitasatospora sp. Root107]|nr:hypothetical protein [Kitasatospora sp. Root107]